MIGNLKVIFSTLRIMGSQVTGGLEIQTNPAKNGVFDPSFLEGPMFLRVRLFQYTFGTQPGQPLPTGYNGIPFIVG